jgi:hypothetical protein
VYLQRLPTRSTGRGLAQHVGTDPPHRWVHTHQRVALRTMLSYLGASIPPDRMG